MYPIQTPSGYVPQYAVSFAGMDGAAIVVDGGHGLPVATVLAAATSTPLGGSTANASTMVGPFTPQLGRAIWLTLSGTWAGTVQLLRSHDGGTTKLPLTWPDGSSRASFNANMNAAVSEETVFAATYYLSVTLSAGTLTYRLEQ